jgi:hypothetical protein
MKLFSQYVGVSSIFSKYWSIYGGFGALFTSPYAHLSLILLFLSGNYWLNCDWWSQPISVLPNLLGFTLGGFAILVSFGDEKFKYLIAGNEEGDGGEYSPYIKFSVTFLHFILLQVLALIWALVINGMQFPVPDWLGCFEKAIVATRPIAYGFGYWLFLYSICTAIAAVMGIFRLTHSFDKFVTQSKKGVNTEEH